MNYEYVFVFDFETSGLDFISDRVIELGGILYKKENFEFKKVLEIDDLIKIDFLLPDKIKEITHITDDMLNEKGILEEELFYKLDNILSLNPLLVAYNLQFDINFIIQMFRRYQNRNYQLSLDVLDVMAIYKDFYSYPHRLESAVNTLNVDILNTHRALDDVKATVEVLKKLSKITSIDPFINVLGYNPKYGVNGERLKHVSYVPQYGNRREIVKRSA